MNIVKPEFWLKKNLFSIILLPLAFITYFINFLKKISFKKKISIKTICVGNIYVGGTGKTSLAIEINEILKKEYKTVFIKKRYDLHQDEINMLKNKGEVISTLNRFDALNLANKKKFKIAILDDGLQQKNIKYDLKIVCFNSQEGIGNGFLIPAGPLRESFYSLKNYDIAFINGEKKNQKLKNKIKSINKEIRIFEGIYKPKNLKNLSRKKNYLMFCGIGNPQEFENTLLKYKFKIKRKIIYPDHYKIPVKEINSIKKLAKKEKLNIITTEKDYYRLNKVSRKNINILKVRLNINNIGKLKKMLNFY
tara:strand:+ start:287 stop:1207 length:921 start_codon:yes stop_codon:yes gene_type:complete